MNLGMTIGPIIVVPYDSQWPPAFRQEHDRIAKAFGSNDVIIEHIGSTSVRELAAKPIIDLMIGLDSLTDAPPLISILQEIGYEYVPEFEDVMPERRYFRRNHEGRRTHHIHMVERESEFWKRHMAFRDFLRVHPEHAKAYGQLKSRLAAQYPQDSEAYMDGKNALIKELEVLALDWYARWRVAQNSESGSGSNQ